MEASPAARPVTELIRANLRRWANESLGLHSVPKRHKGFARGLTTSKETTLIPKESTRTKSEWVTQFQKKHLKRKLLFSELHSKSTLTGTDTYPTNREKEIKSHLQTFLGDPGLCSLQGTLNVAFSPKSQWQKLRCQVAKMIQAFCYHTKGMLQWFQAFRQISQIWTQWQSWRRSWGHPEAGQLREVVLLGHMGRQEVTGFSTFCGATWYRRVKRSLKQPIQFNKNLLRYLPADFNLGKCHIKVASLVNLSPLLITPGGHALSVGIFSPRHCFSRFPKRKSRTLCSNEPQKKTGYFPLNYTGWFIGILIMAYYNPYVTGVVCHPLYNPTNQGLFHCSNVFTQHISPFRKLSQAPLPVSSGPGGTSWQFPSFPRVG